MVEVRVQLEVWVVAEELVVELAVEVLVAAVVVLGRALLEQGAGAGVGEAVEQEEELGEALPVLVVVEEELVGAPETVWAEPLPSEQRPGSLG